MNKAIFVMMVAVASSLFCKGLEEKIRVSSKEIYLSEHELFAKVRGDWVPVEFISHDSKGLYVRLEYQERNDIFRWLCDCGGYNFPTDARCHACGRGRYDYYDEGEEDE